jgi:hypothetical protein
MRNRTLTLVYGAVLLLGMARPAMAQGAAAQGQEKDGQQPSAREQEPAHAQSIDEKLTSLTKDLEVTPERQKQVRSLLQEHHDKIQALFDKNPKASRQELAPQIHPISDETHHKIHALLTDHQKELEKAMLQRGHHGEENRQSAPPAAGPSSSGSS